MRAAPSASCPRPLVLCVVHGLGERPAGAANAVSLARTPHLDALARPGRRTLLAASGTDVGLPEGAPGHGEVGMRNLGAGRIPQTDAARVDAVIADNKLGANEVIKRCFRICKDWSCRLHLFQLVSGAGVHASLDHLHALLKIARVLEVKIVLHAFLDGRDAAPKSAWPTLQRIERALEGVGVVGTVSGRSYAMDRDGRWDRVFKAYTAIVRDDALRVHTAPRAETAFDAIHAAYRHGLTDERIEPIRIGEYEGMVGSFMADFTSKNPVWEWWGEEVGLAVNLRADRMRQLSAMFARKNLPPEALELLTDRTKAVHAFQDWCYNCMTEYDPALELPVAFAREALAGTLPEALADAGRTQLRCGETEKAAHITYFFNGGREAPFPGEDRALVASPRDIDACDKRPEMSTPAVASAAAEAIRGGHYDFILVSLAAPDMIAHTGALDATVAAVEAADAAVGVLADAVREAGGALLVTSDHGSCEQMKDDAGNPQPAHTTNPVPLYYMNDRDEGAVLRDGGRLCDVAPTVLDLLGLPAPEPMIGRTLRVKPPQGS